MTADDKTFVLVNASPDLRQQIMNTAALRARGGVRGSPIRATVVINAEVDHVAGLLTLRERQAFELFATRVTLAALAANPIFNVLAADRVSRNAIDLDAAFEPVPGLAVTAFATPGKVALWQEREGVEIRSEGEGSVALELRQGGKRVVYCPACAKVTPTLRERIEGADALFFDGTTFTDDELISLGLLEKSARRMGHMPMSGQEGSITALADLSVSRKIFVHLNNSNPALIEDSSERRAVEEAGWEVAHDGMEIAL